MPLGGLLSVAPALISGGSALAGLFSGSPSQNVHAPQGYQYQNQGGADYGAYSGIGNLGQYNVAANLLPQYQNIAQNIVNNPYAGQYMQGAGAGGALGMGSGVNAYGAGGQITGNALSQLPDVNALLSLGFDPQNALYSKLQQQNTDQTRAGLSASGVGTTPYGQGIANQSNQNFNLGWQNNLLSRASQGAGAAGGLLSNIGGAVNTGQGLQAGAGGQVLQGGQMPYNAFNNINTQGLQALSGTGGFGQQAAGGQQQQIADYLQYLQGGAGQQGANTSLFGQQLNQANQGFNQNQIMGGQLGGALASLGKGLGQQGWGHSQPSWQPTPNGPGTYAPTYG